MTLHDPRARWAGVIGLQGGPKAMGAAVLGPLPVLSGPAPFGLPAAACWHDHRCPVPQQLHGQHPTKQAPARRAPCPGARLLLATLQSDNPQSRPGAAGSALREPPALAASRQQRRVAPCFGG